MEVIARGQRDRRVAMSWKVAAGVAVAVLLGWSGSAQAPSAPFDHVHLFVPDPAEAADWYITHMGGAPTDSATQVAFGSVLLMFRQAADTKPSTGSVIDRIGFSFRDLNATMAALQSSGMKVLTEPRDVPDVSSPLRVAFIEDPWGAKLELLQDPDTLGLHSVFMRSPDPDALFAWLSDSFGGERRRLKGRFDGLKYEDVWIVPQRSDEAIAPSAGRVIDHIGWRAADVDATIARLKSRGVSITTDPRAAGALRIAYVEGPAGLRVEIVQRPATAGAGDTIPGVGHPSPETFSFLEGYYRPSATSGPSFPSWSPDGRQLAFSMEGSIWVISASGGEATQVTSSPSYDSQPQWSPDGKSLLYSADLGTATELFIVDLPSRQTRQLTTFGRITVDPRWSPDGKTIAFASGRTGSWGTGDSVYFRIWTMPVEGGPAVAVTRASAPATSAATQGASVQNVHIQPSFSPDGRTIVFMSRHPPASGRTVTGSGWIWQIARTGGEPKLVHIEETLYQARPTIAPDGSRIAYISSRHGKNTLTVLPVDGGEPVAMTYGPAEEFHPAWSPDSSQIAFVDNSDDGRLALWVIGANGGVARRVPIASRRYAYPVGQVAATIVSPDGDGAARIYIRAADGKSYFPTNAFHRVQSATGDHYSHVDGAFVVTLPVGTATIEVMKGFEFAPLRETVEVRPDETARLTLRLRRIADMSAAGWWSGDNHVHGNYGGVLGIAPEHLALMQRAEDLNVVHNLICNRDNRIFDLHRFEGKPNPVSRPGRILYYSEEYRPSLYGHMGLLGLKQLVWPFYNGQRGTALAANFPTNADALDMAHAAGGYGGAWHMFNYAIDPAVNDYAGAREVPVDVALGKTDFVEILSLWSNQLTNVGVWYKLLNAGFRVPITAGTDAFANFHRNPAIGGVRVYTRTGSQLTYDGWMKALLAGRSFVTSGPLLQFTVDGREPGDTVHLSESGNASVTVRAQADSIFPMKTLTIVRNGETVARLDLTDEQQTHAELTRTIEIPDSGWLALRVEGDGQPHHLLMKSSVFAHTAPVYVQRGSRPTRSTEAARYFVDWIDSSMENLQADAHWNSAADKQHAITIFQRGRAVYEQMLWESGVTSSAAAR